MLHVAIVGGDGFLGRNLAKKLMAVYENIELTLIDCQFVNIDDKEHKNLRCIQCDILNLAHLAQALIDVDVVFHKAAMLGIPLKSVNMKYSEKYLDINILGTSNIIKVCEKNNVRKIIFDSSIAVFGDLGESYFAQENMDSKPQNFYGLSKHTSEFMIQNSSLSSVIFRYPRVRFSESRDVIYHFIKSVMEDRPITIIGNPLKEIAFVDLSDVMRANVLIIENRISKGLFHISPGDSIKILDLAKLIKELLNKPLHPIVFEEGVDFEPLRTCLSTSNAREVLGYEPRISLFDMIKDTYKYISNC